MAPSALSLALSSWPYSCSKPLWITQMLQKAMKSGLPVACRGQAVVDKVLFHFCYPSRGKSSSKTKIVFSNPYLQLSKEDQVPAGRGDQNAIQVKCFLSLLLLAPDAAARQASTHDGPWQATESINHPQIPRTVSCPFWKSPSIFSDLFFFFLACMWMDFSHMP